MTIRAQRPNGAFDETRATSGGALQVALAEKNPPVGSSIGRDLQMSDQGELLVVWEA